MRVRLPLLLLLVALAATACGGSADPGTPAGPLPTSPPGVTTVPAAPTATAVAMPPPGSTATAAPTGEPPTPVLVLGPAAGQQVTLQVGQELQVRLKDRQWSQPVVDPTVLVVAPLNVLLPQGVFGWNYRALAPGQTTLTSQGACAPAGSGGVGCLSIIVYKITITVHS